MIGLKCDATSYYSYVYQLSFLNDTATDTFTSWTKYPARRLLFEMNGVLIFAQPSGVLAQFSFSVLIVTLTTSLAFLAVAQTIVKLCAQYVLRQRHYYAAQMYERSVDFSGLEEDMAELGKLSVAELRELCRERHLVSEGKRELLTLRIMEDTQRQATEHVAEHEHGEGGEPPAADDRDLGMLTDCWRWCCGPDREAGGTSASASRQQLAKKLFREQMDAHRNRSATASEGGGNHE